MTKKIKTIEDAWKSIEDGTFVGEYAHTIREVLKRELEAKQEDGIFFEKPDKHILYGYESKSAWERKMLKQDRQDYIDENGENFNSNRRRFI